MPIDVSRKAVEDRAKKSADHLQQFIWLDNKPNPHKKKIEPSVAKITDLIPKFVNDIVDEAKHVEAISKAIPLAAIIGTSTKLMGDVGKFLHLLVGPQDLILSEALEKLGEPLIDSFMGTSLGIDMTGVSGANERAIKTIKRVCGFCMMFPFVAGMMGTGLKFIFKGHVGEALAETMGHMGEELGFNWLLGQLLETGFEVAVGQPFEEYIASRTHPKRPEWPQIKVMMKQGHLPPEKADELLNDMGWNANYRKLLMAIDSKQLSMAELQTAWINGRVKEGEVRSYLKELGFDSGDIDILIDNYIRHAETSAKLLYRNAARIAFRQDHITESQFTDILKQADIPGDSIDMEIKAANLEKKTKDKYLSMAMLKSLYQDNEHHADYVRKELTTEGYTDEQINLIIEVWGSHKSSKNKSLTPAHILQYMLDGALSKSDAVDRLVDLGYNPSDAQLMVENPHSKGVKHKFPLTPSTIISAYKAGVLDVTQAESGLAALGVDQTEADLMINVVTFNLDKPAHSRIARKYLQIKDVLAAVSSKFETPHWAYEYLIQDGYAAPDAALLVNMATVNPDLLQVIGNTPTGGDLLSGVLGSLYGAGHQAGSGTQFPDLGGSLAGGTLGIIKQPGPVSPMG